MSGGDTPLAMQLPTLTYLSMDSLAEGVGQSQVLRYVEQFARDGMSVVLHTFEKSSPDRELAARVAAAGIDWRPHEFGAFGARGGLARVVRGSRFIRGAELVHARTEIAAAAALLARPPSWVWDARSLWRDQRIALGTLKPGSAEERVLRSIERRAARRSTAIVTLTRAIVPVLLERFGESVAGKITVIPTCTDLERFRPSEPPPPDPVLFLLTGTLNRYYDVPAMVRLVAAVARKRAARLKVLTPHATAWERELTEAGAERTSARPDDVPRHVADSHVGLCVCRADAGISLKAAMPTKLGEFLASGRPVVVNRGLGDMDEIVAENGCGVVLEGTSDEDVERAAVAIESLLADPTTAGRCRAAAERHFDVARGAGAFMSVYRSAVDRATAAKQ